MRQKSLESNLLLRTLIFLVLLAEQRIRVSGPWLWEAGSLPAEDAERVPPGHRHAAPKPPWRLHIAVWCPVYPSVKGQTLPGAGAEHRGRAGYGQNQTLSAADSNWFVMGRDVGESDEFYLGSSAGHVPCRRERLCSVISMLYQQHWHHTQCVSLGVFLIPSLGQYFAGNRY